MKEGDIIEWVGANKTHRGRVVLSNVHEYIVKMDNGHTFSLNDILSAKSAKLIET